LDQPNTKTRKKIAWNKYDMENERRKYKLTDKAIIIIKDMEKLEDRLER